MQFRQDYKHFSMRNLKLCRMERQRFKVSPQIPLEVFLLLGAHHGALALSEIYEQIPATEKAIRLHLHSLVSSGLIIEQQARDDKRSKEVALTERGFEMLSNYVEEYKNFRLTEGSE
jgi:predicted transcriptional regulator